MDITVSYTEPYPVRPAEEVLSQWLQNANVILPVNRPSVVYRGEKYISLYTHESGEYDFCDKGVRTFTDVFDGTEIAFPTHLPKGKLLLFKRVSNEK